MPSISLLPKQFVFYTCPAHITFFGGAGGGSKTTTGLELANDYAEEFPGFRSCIFRRKTKELNLVKDRFRQRFIANREYGSPPRFNYQMGVAQYPNGSVVHFRHAFRKEDIEDNLSEEYGFIDFDEASTFLPYQLQYAMTRNRTPDTVRNEYLERPRNRIGYFSNPGGVSHMHLYHQFVNPQPEQVARVLYWYPWLEAETLWEECLKKHGNKGNGLEEAKLEWLSRQADEGLGWRAYEDDEIEEIKEVAPGPVTALEQAERFDVWQPYPSPYMEAFGVDPENVPTRCFIPSFVRDNPHIDYNSYVATLADAGNPPNVIEAILVGNWMIFEGQFFSEFKPTLTDGTPWHVIEPILPEPHWPVWASMDWGYGPHSLSVVLWHTYDVDREQIITFNELAVNAKSDPEIINLIKAYSQNLDVRTILCDPQMFKHRAHTGQQETIGDYYRREGLPANPLLHNNREQGWRLVRAAMASSGNANRPRWCCTSSCRNLIETLPELVYDEDKHEDLDSDGPDHAADALRYGLAGAPMGRGTRIRQRYAQAPIPGSIRSNTTPVGVRIEAIRRMP